MRQRLLLGNLSDAAMRPANVIVADHHRLDQGDGDEEPTVGAERIPDGSANDNQTGRSSPFQCSVVCITTTEGPRDRLRFRRMGGVATTGVSRRQDKLSSDYFLVGAEGAAGATGAARAADAAIGGNRFIARTALNIASSPADAARAAAESPTESNVTRNKWRPFMALLEQVNVAHVPRCVNRPIHFNSGEVPSERRCSGLPRARCCPRLKERAGCRVPQRTKEASNLATLMRSPLLEAPRPAPQSKIENLDLYTGVKKGGRGDADQENARANENLCSAGAISASRHM